MDMKFIMIILRLLIILGFSKLAIGYLKNYYQIKMERIKMKKDTEEMWWLILTRFTELVLKQQELE